MAWEQLSVNKPHLAYLILGGFTSLFMLCSLFVKEKMYIGEATVATLCGVIFGPHAANIFSPRSWGNTDQITLECSRVVLVVQCFAVGVELPKAYMERHWKSVVLLLLPVMTFGWLITSLFIWWMIVPLSWLESLMCAACVTATDPVLASSVVGKGKFAKRVPKHLRDLLSAESGCNDGMAFPFIYLSYYLIHYRPDANKVSLHWFCNTILYECIFGAVYGILIGYFGRHAIKWADRKGLIDRESFLVFYFVLALFCAGTGSTLGTDDLLVGFAAGVGFSNDGWFTQKTEESHVSNVIDLLLNLAYFVYLGAIIPWEQFNNPLIGLSPWRLVVISILVIFFRRIPIMMVLKPFIPDIKTWREALFAGHFGPIGVGAIFAAILARAELETDTTVPLAVVPTDPHAENYMVIHVIWPLTTFLVITSILVHGSSIAVFTLGKRINSFTLTMSYTQANEEGPSWMNRLPRIASTAKGSMSKGKEDFSVPSSAEELHDLPPGTLPPIGLPGNFLRRQKEEDTPIEHPRPARRKSKWDSRMGLGGPISRSAITPQRRSENLNAEDSVSDTLNEKNSSPSGSADKVEPPVQLEIEDEQERQEEKEPREPHQIDMPEIEVYEEGEDMVVEDVEGNIVGIHNTMGETDAEKIQQVLEDEKKVRADRSGQFAKGMDHPHEKDEGSDIEEAVEEGLAHPEQSWKKISKKFGGWNGFKKESGPSKPEPARPKEIERKSGQAAHAYQFGQTLIVEDEDGEVIKKIDLGPKATKRSGSQGGVQDGGSHFDATTMRQGLRRMSTWAGLGGGKTDEAADTDQKGEGNGQSKSRKKSDEDPDDDRIRFTVGTSGRRMSKQEFVQQLQRLDPKARREMVEESDAPRAVKDEVHADAIQESRRGRSALRPHSGSKRSPDPPALGAVEERAQYEEQMPVVRRIDTEEDKPSGDDNLAYVDSDSGETVPFYNVPQSIQKHAGKEETAAQRRRRIALRRQDSEDDGTERIPLSSIEKGGELQRNPLSRLGSSVQVDEHGETAAERRRRLAALGEGEGVQEDSDSEDDGGERQPKRGHQPGIEPSVVGLERRAPGIRFADSPAVSQGRIQWGDSVGRKGKR
ncbi:MAG: hypothetical protein Q9217_003326 [Psora testacea]